MKKLTAFTLGASLICFQGLCLASTGANLITDPNKPIIVTSSLKDFTITLNSNPSIGYSWFISKYNSHILKPTNHHYFSPNTKTVGASGHDTWTFQVNNDSFLVPHNTKITMVYARPWEKDIVKKLTFIVRTE